MSDDLEPLPALGALARKALAAEQRRPDADGAMQERVLGRVVASVAVGAAVTAAAAGTASASAGASAGAGAGAGAGASAGATAAAGVTAKTVPWIVLAFLAGGGAGAAVHAAVATQPVAVVSSAAPVRSVPVAAPEGPATAAPTASSVPVMMLPSASASVATAATGARPAPTGPSASATGATSAGASDVDLAAERALVDRARTALGRGQAADALDALDAHLARFPRGRLSEEREALAVDALARLGRRDAAAARASRFRAAYPNSVFTGVVDAATQPR